MADRRPIRGAVATLGVSERVSFLRRTYAHLGIALVAWAAATAGMMRFMPETSLSFSRWALTGRWNWFLVLGAFMLVGYVAERMARSNTSRGIQYGGLALFVAAEALLLQPILWVAIIRFGASEADKLILNAGLITVTIFVGLTATVFLTKKDFSFLRGILTVLTFAALGVIIASMIFGFQLGAIFCGAMIALMAGYILYQTSAVMKDFPPTHHVAAALMLFSTIATLFWYVLQLLMSLKGDD
ncbi:MAG: permease [Kofleriaceae bacterium]|nr:MAG: permease [Kofleriaceae bacterium]MBZ0236631.1 Bax inhibitor-1 family protein [Kofleriaceae bacterium]